MKSSSINQIKELPAFHLWDIAAMVNYTEFYDDSKFKITAGDNNYELVGYYCKNPDCDCTKARFSVQQYEEEIGEIWYDYEKKELVESSSFAHLIKKVKASDEWIEYSFEDILRQRHLIIKNTFKIFKLKSEQKKLKESLVGLKDQIKRIHKLNKKIGRNEPCPCGSGKKYKKCCL